MPLASICGPHCCHLNNQSGLQHSLLRRHLEGGCQVLRRKHHVSHSYVVTVPVCSPSSIPLYLASFYSSVTAPLLSLGASSHRSPCWPTGPLPILVFLLIVALWKDSRKERHPGSFQIVTFPAGQRALLYTQNSHAQC